MESGRPLGRGQTLITLDGLKKLGDELVRLCDSIERHGLVDYQYGVWEEQITESRLTTPGAFEDSNPLTLEFTVLLECHDLYSPDDAAGAPAAAGSSR